MTISLDAQIHCVERELKYRRRCYPRWVDQQRMTQRMADNELAAMEAVRQTLIDLRNSQELFGR